MRSQLGIFLAIGLLALLPVSSAGAQADAASWSVQAGLDYVIVPDITYLTADGYESKLDVYSPRDKSRPRPTLIYIHGDADTVVPYQHAVRLHQKLEEAGVGHQLHTVPGGDHGSFSAEQYQAAYTVIRTFLIEHLDGD